MSTRGRSSFRRDLADLGLTDDQALDKLPSIYADVMRLLLDGFTISETAKRLGIPIGTVQARLAKTLYLREEQLAVIAVDRAQRGTKRVMPSAARLLATAARLLPATDRARYAEEYRSELWEIAHAGQPRRRQVHYASRQVISSLRLRAELLAPRRRRASP